MADARRAARELGWKPNSSRCEACATCPFRSHSRAVLHARFELMQQFVNDGRAIRLKEQNDEFVKAALAFAGIFGVGREKAATLCQAGFKDIKQLRAQVAADEAAGTPDATLTVQQRIGLRHYEDLQQRIPRAEMDALYAIVKRHADELAPGCQAHIVGSYRRGADSSGEVLRPAQLRCILTSSRPMMSAQATWMCCSRTETKTRQRSCCRIW